MFGLQALVIIHFNTIVFDHSSLVLTNQDEPTQQASRLPHLSTTVQITVRPVDMRLSFRAADCVAVLWGAATLSFHRLFRAPRKCLHYKQARQCMHNVALRRVRATTVAVDTQYILHILRVCL